uniref:Uncharacterized protein n=1 Tax=viral metagenome TaxID=1070528 RepID=A0A6M3LU48_9ZZZZ
MLALWGGWKSQGFEPPNPLVYINLTPMFVKNPLDIITKLKL